MILSQLFHADLHTALHSTTAAFFFLSSAARPRRHRPVFLCCSSNHNSRDGYQQQQTRPLSVVAREAAKEAEKAAKETSDQNKPVICTADELHYVPVPGTPWRISLWRYFPSPEAPPRNHPLMLLSGVGTNAIGYDLSPGASFARYMSKQGFDTWIVEVRGAGLSQRCSESEATDSSANQATVYNLESVDKGKSNGNVLVKQHAEVSEGSSSDSDMLFLDVNDESEDLPQLVTKLTDIFLRLAERVSGYLNERQSRVLSAKFLDQISKLLEDFGLSERFNEIRDKLTRLLEARQNSTVATQIRDLSELLVNILDESQRSVSPPLFSLQERLSTTVEDFQKQLDLILTYDWDFDNYLEEDVPAAIEYINSKSNPKDGKLLAIGHSMGGILLYAMLSRCCAKGESARLAAVVTLASSVDYTTSRSSLKLLLPLADPAQALNVPAVPLGAMLTAAYPLTSRPPYVLSWLNSQISAQGMMHPELLERLILKNFCTIPAKLLLQLTTAFRDRGLRDRSGTFFYKDHLHECNIPILAVAGDEDLICPPEAVYETVKILPKQVVTYKVFGKPNGPHYAHYDLVGGRMAIDEVYPCVVQFLNQHDQLSSPDSSHQPDTVN